MTMQELRQDASMWRQMVWAIVEMREAGCTYDEIDGTLTLPCSSYRIMNSARTRAVLAA